MRREPHRTSPSFSGGGLRGSGGLFPRHGVHISRTEQLATNRPISLLDLIDAYPGHRLQRRHFVPGTSAIFASVRLLGPLLVVLAPGAPRFEKKRGAVAGTLTMDVVDPLFL